MKEIDYSPADAVCSKCGTTKEDTKTAFCINGHDSWLEQGDDLDLFQKTSKDLNCTMEELINAIQTNTDIVIKK